jgi:hypothetical protein
VVQSANSRIRDRGISLNGFCVQPTAGSRLREGVKKTKKNIESLTANHVSALDKGASIGQALAKCTKLGKVHFSRARKIGSVVRSPVSEDMSSKRKVHLTKPFYSKKKYIFEYLKKT